MEVYVLHNEAEIVGVFQEKDEAYKAAVRLVEEVTRYTWKEILYDSTDDFFLGMNLESFFDATLEDFAIRVVSVPFKKGE